MRNASLDEAQAGIKIARKNINNCIHAEYIMQNAGLDEAHAGIKTTGRNIKNLRFADDTTLMAEKELTASC